MMISNESKSATWLNGEETHALTTVYKMCVTAVPFLVTCRRWLSVSISINALSVIITFFRCIYFFFFYSPLRSSSLLFVVIIRLLFLFKYHMEFSFSAHVHISHFYSFHLRFSFIFCAFARSSSVSASSALKFRYFISSFIDK